MNKETVFGNKIKVYGNKYRNASYCTIAISIFQEYISIFIYFCVPIFSGTGSMGSFDINPLTHTTIMHIK